MYVATVPNRNSPPAILLRESYRLDGKVKTRTIANISHLGGVSRNPRKFRHSKSSPARRASRSIILPPLWNV